MESPKTYLLKKIIGYKENGYKSLGDLHAQHIDDLAKIMGEFAEETVIDVVNRINKGEVLHGSNFTLELGLKNKKLKS